MSKEKISIRGVQIERSSSYSGKLFLYKNLNSGIVGSFGERLLPLYDTIFEITNKEFIKQNKDDQIRN
jgi:hypothetical protein